MEFKLIYLARRNPSIRPEDWPRAWRSHAVFASQFPVLGARISSLYYCSRVFAPMPGGTPFDPPGAAHNYDGVAVVARPSAQDLDIEMRPEDRVKIEQDELRVFGAPTVNSSFRCREVLVHGGAPGGAAVIRFLARKRGSSKEAFVAHWSQYHADLGKGAAAAATRYVHNALIAEPPPGHPYDGITETWFATVEGAVRSFADGASVAVAQDLPAFCDMERTVTMLTGVVHRWPRA